MGVSQVDDVAAALLSSGLSPDTPAAVVSAAHTPQQAAARCTLQTLSETVATHGLVSPALLKMGAVAALGDAPAISAPPVAGLG